MAEKKEDKKILGLDVHHKETAAHDPVPRSGRVARRHDFGPLLHAGEVRDGGGTWCVVDEVGRSAEPALRRKLSDKSRFNAHGRVQPRVPELGGGSECMIRQKGRIHDWRWVLCRQVYHSIRVCDNRNHCPVHITATYTSCHPPACDRAPAGRTAPGKTTSSAACHCFVAASKRCEAFHCLRAYRAPHNKHCGGGHRRSG